MREPITKGMWVRHAWMTGERYEHGKVVKVLRDGTLVIAWHESERRGSAEWGRSIVEPGLVVRIQQPTQLSLFGEVK